MFHVVTGGSASGKSEYAEWLLEEYAAKETRARLYYVATMIPYDDEMRMKVAAHQRRRAGKGFQTIECGRGLSEVMRRQFGGRCAENTKVAVLLECMSNLVANELFGGAGKEPEKVLEGISFLRQVSDLLVVVTNEVFSDGGGDTQQMRGYMEMLGKINREMAAEADRVTEVVYGIPVEVKR